jgi:hypothetical protein
MQHPEQCRVVPDVDFVRSDTIQALVDFHEGRYTLPDKFGTLAHQVLVADGLGDDSFLNHISEMLMVPVGRINSLNRTKM